MKVIAIIIRTIVHMIIGSLAVGMIVMMILTIGWKEMLIIIGVISLMIAYVFADEYLNRPK